MSTSSHLTESDRGYLSAESKRRFTLIAGLLGAVFFLAQTLLPVLIVFLIMMPMMLSQPVSTIDVDEAAVWRDELWFVQRTAKLNWRNPPSSAGTLGLARARLADLAPIGDAVPLRSSPCSWPSFSRFRCADTGSGTTFTETGTGRLRPCGSAPWRSCWISSLSLRRSLLPSHGAGGLFPIQIG